MSPVITAEIEIDLRPEVLGVCEFTPSLSKRIADHIDAPEGTLRETVAALIDVHRGNNDDKRQLKEKYGRMRIELRTTRRGVALRCREVPADSLLHGTIPIRQQRQISQAVRDLVLPPAPPEESDDPSAALSAHVKRFIARTPLLAQAPRPRAFVWGGHSAGRDEYDFAKECGYWDALGLPLTHKSAISEPLGGQPQGAPSPGQPPCLKRAQRGGWPPSGSPVGHPPEAPGPRCGACQGITIGRAPRLGLALPGGADGRFVGKRQP